MTKLLASLIATGFFLAGCVVVPVEVAEERSASNFCPPGQAKKGNCTPGEGRGFCPPGQAKKGNC